MTTLSRDDLRALVKPDRIHRRVFLDPGIFALEMDRIFSRTWEETTGEALADMSLSEAVRDLLPEGRLRIVVTTDDDQTRQIVVEIDWLDRAGQRVDPVRLVAWKVKPKP